MSSSKPKTSVIRILLLIRMWMHTHRDICWTNTLSKSRNSKVFRALVCLPVAFAVDHTFTHAHIIAIDQVRRISTICSNDCRFVGRCAVLLELFCRWSSPHCRVRHCRPSRLRFYNWCRGSKQERGWLFSLTLISLLFVQRVKELKGRRWVGCLAI